MRCRTPPDLTRLAPRDFAFLLIRRVGRVVDRENPRSRISAAVNSLFLVHSEVLYPVPGTWYVISRRQGTPSILIPRRPKSRWPHQIEDRPRGQQTRTRIRGKRPSLSDRLHAAVSSSVQYPLSSVPWVRV